MILFTIERLYMVRPREFSFPPEQMIELGKEMVSWVLDNQQTILHLSQWYTIHKGYTYNEWKNFIAKEEFFPYYEQALKIVGIKYIDKNTNVRDKISDRWQRIYFRDLSEQEDLDADAEVTRKLQAIKGDARAQELERQAVLDEVQRNKRKPKV